MPGPQNAQDFIRALKASLDPPHVGGPAKIEIARHAWDDVRLYVPNKAEAIVDWLLSRLLKDRAKERSENPLSDTRYWQLLADILSDSTKLNPADRGHALRAWLVPLLNRIPLAPILLSYFELLSSAAQVDVRQAQLVFQSFYVLWPLAAPKFNPETLLDCFGAVVQLGVSPDEFGVSCGRLRALGDLRALSEIVSSYRASLANSAAKRKQLYALFLKRSFVPWLRVVVWGGGDNADIPPLLSAVYDAGVETLFGLDIIKQTADHKHDAALLAALDGALKQSPEILFRCLPRLFESYVYNVKRHRGALFSQGSNQAPGHTTEQVQRVAMTFFASCDTLVRLDGSDLSWRCRVSFLSVVESENLLFPRDDEAKALLRVAGDLAVEVLASAWDEHHAERTHSAVQTLTALARIDHDLMAASFPVLYPRLMAIPSEASSTLQYLGLLLDYDSKARALPATILRISEAFSSHHLERIIGGPHVAYRVASAGPLTSLPFLDDLSRAVHSFLTPSQVLETIGDALRTLTDAYERFVEREATVSADRGDGPRKKRKKEAAAPKKDGCPELEYLAVSFALVARTMVSVLRAVPLHTVTDDVRAEAEELIRRIYSQIAVHALRDGFGNAGRAESQAWQFVIIGALRLQYGLALGYGQVCHGLDEKLLAVLLSYVGSDGMVPELNVEMFRTLLHQCSVGHGEPAPVLDKMMRYLETYLPKDNTSWTGKSHCLTSHNTGGVAVLHLLVDRWLPAFDAWATSHQLERFASMLVNTRHQGADWRSQPGLTVDSILYRMFHDAQFWELSRIRESFLAQLLKQTAGLDVFNLAALLQSRSSSITPDVTIPITSVYETLILIPPEYLPRTAHNEFLRRGFVGDVLVSLCLRDSRGPLCSDYHLLVVREVLRRTISYLGTFENVAPKEYLDFLLEHKPEHSVQDSATADLTSTTMDLIDMYQSSLIRAAKRGSADPVVELIRDYLVTYKSRSVDMVTRASLLFVDTLVQNSGPADFPDACLTSLRALHQAMHDFCVPQLSPGSSNSDMTLDHMVLDVWSHLQTLGRWLKIEEASTVVIGKQLAKTLLSYNGSPDGLATLAPIVISILLGELQNNDERDRVEYMIVAYLSFARHCGDKGIANLDSRLTTACRTLPAEVFATVLDLVYDGLPLHKGLSAQDVASLIRLSTVILRDAPEGTSKICQAHITRCLNVFADNEQFTTSPTLRTEVVDFLVRQCGDKPASLRNVDLSSLWSLLRAFLAGSVEHENTTDATVFHGIVNVLSALVRLRRDLVLNTLPHLGFVLRRLIFCLRTMRPQLGGKQSRLVMDTLPRWIAPDSPLAAPESKALARLLTTLTTKTMVRTHGPGAETQKPESLVRPFSKHAAYVLTAYVEAANDPLCTLALAVRKELQPGLFALCDMLGEHNRDAMMVAALDAGGKATMKTLWKEYEKQRYVGKG